MTKDEIKTITRKEPCPVCKNDMKMDIDPADGYGAGIYLCICGQAACQNQTHDDWVGAPEKINCQADFLNAKEDGHDVVYTGSMNHSNVWSDDY